VPEARPVLAKLLTFAAVVVMRMNPEEDERLLSTW
jgi:hypothetical protein